MAAAKSRSAGRKSRHHIGWLRSQRVAKRSLLPTALNIEPLENRTLLSGLPTLIDIFAGAGGSDPRDFTNVNNTVFFRANDGVNGVELWKTDGTATGTLLVKNIHPGAIGSNPANLT